ncbi:MAG: hypothetical protein LKG20_08220 [Tetrasphaera jenkinsii]|jgi:cold shock CspA family protein|uniref:Cold shock protein n=1 Tax=Nostocoides jenkinsii Ben 74 TaxID=1193518 RepID=A0A077MD09_9MICO|nr:hypothetical protein [Tetrasphaera jenkinsii]MCI1262246.1 hypothetical protein [Tetrasphaera jenkinsii]CCI54469.1 conserved hypothetical protein [Tetrasphaera jenkinsii Ben 74]
MQATVHRFDADDASGELIRDDGRVVPFERTALVGSGLRHLRVGQRVSLELAGESVTRIWIVGIGDGQAIG